MNDELKDRILEQIQEQHLEPRPSWWFRLRGTVKHFAVAILFALAALGLAGCIYILVENGTLADLRLGPQWARPAFFDLPWQLLVLTVVLGVMSFALLRHTARLYRVARGWLITGLIVAVVAGAGAAYATSLTRYAFRTGPGRQFFAHGGNPFWSPRSGAVVGIVVSRTTKRWAVDGMTGQRWLVIVTKKTYFPAGSDIPVGTVVRVIGRRAQNTIYADGIRPIAGLDDMMRPGGSGMTRPGDTMLLPIILPEAP